MRDLEVTYRRLGEIHDAVRARHPDVPARAWADLTDGRRLGLLLLDLAQHHADVRGRDERRITPEALVDAALSAGSALGYHGVRELQELDDLGIRPLYAAFAEALIAEVTP